MANANKARTAVGAADLQAVIGGGRRSKNLMFKLDLALSSSILVSQNFPANILVAQRGGLYRNAIEGSEQASETAQYVQCSIVWRVIYVVLAIMRTFGV